MATHATEEHITPASVVMSYNNRRTGGSGIFCWLRPGAYTWRTGTQLSLRRESKEKSREVESLERVCRQTDQSESEAAVTQSPLVEVWEPPLS
jgi:hypothetical protein